jgi:hypothetical protein
VAGFEREFGGIIQVLNVIAASQHLLANACRPVATAAIQNGIIEH